jgi:transposase
MEVQTEVYLESLDRVEDLSGPTGRRKWPDEVKGRLVGESLVPGVSVREVAERNDLMPNRLSTWRSQARRAELVIPDIITPNALVPEVAAHNFTPIILTGTAPVVKGLCPIELETSGVTLRLDANTDARWIASLVSALKSAS